MSIIEEIDSRGIKILLCSIILCFVLNWLDYFRLTLTTIIVLFPIGFGFLFRDEERDSTDDYMKKIFMAFCKGSFLQWFIISPIVALIIGIIWFLTILIK